jgi:hypothetical protein
MALNLRAMAGGIASLAWQERHNAAIHMASSKRNEVSAKAATALAEIARQKAKEA